MNIVLDDLDSTEDVKIVLGFADNSGSPFEQIKLKVTANSIQCMDSTSIPPKESEHYLELYSKAFNYAKGIQLQLKGKVPESNSVRINHDRGDTFFHEIASFVDQVRLCNPGKSDIDIEMIRNDDSSDHEDVTYMVVDQSEKDREAAEREAEERRMYKILKEKYG